jgi:hypothetical protein
LVWREVLEESSTNGVQALFSEGRFMSRHGLVSASLSLALAAVCATGSQADPPRFETDIAPILRDHCFKCHGAEVRNGGLDLRTVAAILHGGDTGAAVVPGKSGESLIVEQISSRAMPPAKDAKLSDLEVATVRGWIDAGARGESHVGPSGARAATTWWSFHPPRRPQIPAVRQAEQVRNPVDAFLLARLEAKGLSFSPEASRLTLLRRLCFDFWGLPPTPEQTDQFLTDTRPDAVERLINSLLASPRYGERWGRHWLDVAGYADSEGILDADYERAAAWRYRDYVIRSFNADTPYDRFLQLQIAGDEVVDYPAVFRTRKTLGPEVVEALVATGYLRCASDTSRPDFVNIKNAPGYYYQTLEDTMKIVASSVMGLTLQCAKCHSHKYDPLTQEEYYRVQAIFMSGYRPAHWVPQVERKLSEATACQQAEASAYNASIDRQVAELNAKAQALKTAFATRLFDDRLAKLPEPIREDTRLALAAKPGQATDVQKYLAAKFGAVLHPPEKELNGLLEGMYPDYKAQAAGIVATVARLQSTKRAFPEIRAFYDLPGDAKTPILKRGDYTQPGALVRPGVPLALETAQPFSWSPPPADAPTSGRRLALAKWLTQRDHPLTARVMVNRIWLLHFGEGIVSTPDNFGRTGALPDHPELLDWLATEFVARGWSVKAMHRLILNSTAYRQVSQLDPSSPAHAKAKRADPEDRLLWRQRMRRVEAEVLRDSMLAISGVLNRRMFGAPVSLVNKGDGEVVAPADASGLRRSIYLNVRRSQPLTLLQSFDQPVMETNCTRRDVSTVASQALNLLNSDTSMKYAEALARRVENVGPESAVARAVRLALDRPARPAERSALDLFLGTQTELYARLLAKAKSEPTAAERQQGRHRALTDLCQMLLSSNEFAYVD